MIESIQVGDTEIVRFFSKETEEVVLNSVYGEDCLSLLKRMKNNSVDLIVTSPPYNIGKEYEQKTSLSDYLEWQRKIICECHRVLNVSGSIFWQVGSFVDSGSIIPLDIKLFPIFESLGMYPINRIIWARQHGLHASKKFSCRHESILWFSKSKNYKFSLDDIRVPQKYQNKKAHTGANKGALTCNPEGKNPGDVWVFRNVKHNHEEQTIHPCQFPEDLIARIILSTTSEKDVVFDPFMGTGTVAVVAAHYNRHFIGTEIEKKYLDVLTRRILCAPNHEGSFANLKCLREYAKKRLNNNTSGLKFDVQVGENATSSDQAKIFDEDHHRLELFDRLNHEENHWRAKINGEKIEDTKSFKPQKERVM